VPTVVVDVSSPFGKEGSGELSIQRTSLGGVADIYKIVTVVHAEFIGVTSGRTARIRGRCNHPWTLHPWTLLRPAVYAAAHRCTVDSSPLQLIVALWTARRCSSSLHRGQLAAAARRGRCGSRRCWQVAQRMSDREDCETREDIEENSVARRQ
jgi:hypothetical protein